MLIIFQYKITGSDFYRYQPHILSLLDIQYSSQTNYFSKFKVGEADALIYEYVMNAYGTATQWPMGLFTTQVIIGVVAGTAIGYGIHEATDDDDVITCVPPLIFDPISMSCI